METQSSKKHSLKVLGAATIHNDLKMEDAYI